MVMAQSCDLFTPPLPGSVKFFIVSAGERARVTATGESTFTSSSPPPYLHFLQPTHHHLVFTSSSPPSPPHHLLIFTTSSSSSPPRYFSNVFVVNMSSTFLCCSSAPPPPATPSSFLLLLLLSSAGCWAWCSSGFAPSVCCVCLLLWSTETSLWTKVLGPAAMSSHRICLRVVSLPVQSQCSPSLVTGR